MGLVPARERVASVLIAVNLLGACASPDPSQHIRVVVECVDWVKLESLLGKTRNPTRVSRVKAASRPRLTGR